MDNTDRAASAEAAVDAFRRVCGTDREDAVGDLICNLMHLAEADGDDPIKIISKAISHHYAETHYERECKIEIKVTPVDYKKPLRKRSDYAAALKKITEIKAGPNSEPDVMGEALAEIDRIATTALA